ncbi:unnamed protein product [Durusdinium trenchii]|uniref:Uncharacterized protein n=1 Tax=Durusdinium trenchii TaxID=1381693 RepID=A0ABP0HRG0_9DINO
MRQIFLGPSTAKESYKGLVGNTILLAQAEAKTTQILPSLNKVLDQLVIVFTRSVEEVKTCKALTVNRAEFVDCLRLRKKHCPVFFDTDIDQDAVQKLPVEGVPNEFIEHAIHLPESTFLQRMQGPGDLPVTAPPSNTDGNIAEESDDDESVHDDAPACADEGHERANRVSKTTLLLAVFLALLDLRWRSLKLLKPKGEGFSMDTVWSAQFLGFLQACKFKMVTQRLLLPVVAAERLKHVEREIAASEQQQRPPANFFKEASLTGAELSTLPEYKLLALMVKMPVTLTLFLQRPIDVTMVSCRCNCDFKFLIRGFVVDEDDNKITLVCDDSCLGHVMGMSRASMHKHDSRELRLFARNVIALHVASFNTDHYITKYSTKPMEAMQSAVAQFAVGIRRLEEEESKAEVWTPQYRAKRVIVRLAAAANRSTWVSSTELATTILCAGHCWATHAEVVLFLSRPWFLMQQCRRLLENTPSPLLHDNFVPIAAVELNASDSEDGASLADDSAKEDPEETAVEDEEQQDAEKDRNQHWDKTVLRTTTTLHDDYLHRGPWLAPMPLFVYASRVRRVRKPLKPKDHEIMFEFDPHYQMHALYCQCFALQITVPRIVGPKPPSLDDAEADAPPDDEDSFDEELHSQTKAAVAKLLRKEMLQSDATTSCPASENLTPEMAVQQLEELFDRNANRDEAQVTEIDVPLAWKGPAAYAKSLIDKFPFNQEQLDLLALLVNPLEVAWRNREDTSVYTLPVDLGCQNYRR